MFTETLTTPATRRIAPDDRRDCTRVPMDRLIAIVEGVPYEGFGDLSTGGAYFTGKARARPGQVLTLQATVDEAGPLKVRAEVLSACFERGGLVSMHLRFIDAPFETERRIARHVDECVLLTGGLSLS